MEKLDYIIDIQGFQDKNSSFIPKEIAVLAVECNIFSHWIVKSPYNSTELPKPVLATNSYLTCFHHGIEWFDGESTLDDVYNALRDVARNALRIYVRGIQKQNLLEEILGRQVLNLEEYNCPSFKNLPRINEHFCFYHGRKREYFSCSLAYAYKLRLWLMKTVYILPENDTESINNTLQKKKNRISFSYTIDNSTKPKSGDIKVSISNNHTSTSVENSTNPTSGRKQPKRKEENLYDQVSDELSPNSTSTQPYTSPDSGSFSCGQDSFSLGGSICTCN